MVKLNPAQQIALDRVFELHEEVITSRRLLKRRIEEEFAKQMDGLIRRRSRAANAAIAAGVPKTRVGRALGTSDWSTISDILSMTASEFEDQQQALASANEQPWVIKTDQRDRVVGITLHRWEDATTGEQRSGSVYIDLLWNDYSKVWTAADHGQYEQFGIGWSWLYPNVLKQIDQKGEAA